MARKRDMLIMEIAEDYTGYPARILREAVKRGDLRAERPGNSPKARLYFEQTELDRWMADSAVSR